MSACISRHGEFGSHDLDDEYTCRLCGVLDEDALRTELDRLRAGITRMAKAGDEAAELLQAVETAEADEVADVHVKYVRELRKVLDGAK